jgi:propane monooxygenase reductase subunit
MIDALQPILFMQDFDPDRIFFDRFTPSTGSSAH